MLICVRGECRHRRKEPGRGPRRSGVDRHAPDELPASTEDEPRVVYIVEHDPELAETRPHHSRVVGFESAAEPADRARRTERGDHQGTVPEAFRARKVHHRIDRTADRRDESRHRHRRP